MAVLRVSVPDPAWVTAPSPVIAAVEKSVPWVTASDWLNLRFAPLAMLIALLVESDPAAPPLPSCSVPALIVVAPV